VLSQLNGLVMLEHLALFNRVGRLTLNSPFAGSLCYLGV